MSVVGSNILAGASGAAGAGYEIERSVRINGADTAHFSKTLNGNGQTFSLSLWVKRTKLGINAKLFASGVSSNNTQNALGFDASDRLQFYEYSGGLTKSLLTTHSMIYCYNRVLKVMAQED